MAGGGNTRCFDSGLRKYGVKDLGFMSESNSLVSCLRGLSWSLYCQLPVFSAVIVNWVTVEHVMLVGLVAES